jgi:hypothetical protein
MMPQSFPVPVVSRCYVRPRRRPVALLVGLALSLGVIIGAQATTTWTVCASSCNYTSIKAAIAASTARNGDTLAIDAGNYTEAGIGVNKSLTLQGAGAASTPSTVSNRVFWILRGVTVTIRGLTIRYGLVRDSSYGYGGGRLNEGTLTLTNCTVSSNAAHYSSGGGLDNRGTLTLTNSTVSGNSADDGGGFFNSGRFNSQTRFTNSIIANHVSGGTARTPPAVQSHPPATTLIAMGAVI